MDNGWRDHMVTDNQSSGQGQGGQSAGTQGKQQTSEISQGTASSQQGSGSAQRPQGSGQGYGSSQGQRGAQDTDYSGHYGSGGSMETGQDYQRGSQRRQGWQQPSSSALQTRGSAFASPYLGGYGSGPFSMMRRITDEMDRLFENFGLGRSFFPSDLGSESSASLWSPHVEVSEREGKIVVYADLPGVKKEDVSVEINPDSITIQGQRHQESTRDERGYYHSERVYGSFFRTIPLPEGADIENASATFRDGVLQIEVQAPKPKSHGRTLEIKGGDGGSSDSGQRSVSGSSGTSGATGSSERQR
jgi:HSP20 family protein